MFRYDWDSGSGYVSPDHEDKIMYETQPGSIDLIATNVDWKDDTVWHYRVHSDCGIEDLETSIIVTCK